MENTFSWRENINARRLPSNVGETYDQWLGNVYEAQEQCSDSVSSEQNIQPGSSACQQ